MDKEEKEIEEEMKVAEQMLEEFASVINKYLNISETKKVLGRIALMEELIKFHRGNLIEGCGCSEDHYNTLRTCSKKFILSFCSSTLKVNPEVKA